MINIDVIAVGRMREKHYIAAAEEYIKRLSGYCKIKVTEIQETQLSREPSAAEIASALETEFGRMKLPAKAAIFALCVEGEQLSSQRFAEKLEDLSIRGCSHMVFVIGGSFGLAQQLKDQADMRLSMSEMTFPHHLARVMLLEQLYRAFNISSGGKYNK